MSMNSAFRAVSAAALGDMLLIRDSKKPFIVGINGIDSSGKTTFAKYLHEFIEASGIPCTLIHGDDFHNEKTVRYRNDDPICGYLNDSFNYSRLVTEVLEPIRQGYLFSNISLTVLDLERDAYCKNVEYQIAINSIILVEGVLLFSDVLLRYFDYRIFIDAPFDVAVRRAIERDTHIPMDEIPIRYANKYHAAQQIYLDAVRPIQLSNAIIDNSGATPVIDIRSCCAG